MDFQGKIVPNREKDSFRTLGIFTPGGAISAETDQFPDCSNEA
jgi:hypothetical protein